jgi:hypothetical protein
MKRLLFLIVLFCTPAFAADLPVIWLETQNESQTIIVDQADNMPMDWALRHEHRILDRGTNYTVLGFGQLALKTKVSPPKPGVCLNAKLFFGETPRYNVIVASPDPFEDRKEWFDKHPIALYDPEKTTAELLEEEEIPFKRLRSFADIEAVENVVIVIGEETDFDREKGLAELLFQKAAQGGNVFVVAPKGYVQLYFSHTLRSLLMTEDPKHLFPNASKRAMMETWILHSWRSEVMIRSSAMRWDRGMTVVDICFDNFPQKNGRIIFDREPIFSHWGKRVESRWYFKSLIETLTNDGLN